MFELVFDLNFFVGVSFGSLLTLFGITLIWIAWGNRQGGGYQPVKGKPLGPPPGYTGKWPL